jgi:hypothetical protein
MNIVIHHNHLVYLVISMPFDLGGFKKTFNCFNYCFDDQSYTCSKENIIQDTLLQYLINSGDDNICCIMYLVTTSKT